MVQSHRKIMTAIFTREPTLVVAAFEDPSRRHTLVLRRMPLLCLFFVRRKRGLFTCLALEVVAQLSTPPCAWAKGAARTLCHVFRLCWERMVARLTNEMATQMCTLGHGQKIPLVLFRLPADERAEFKPPWLAGYACWAFAQDPLPGGARHLFLSFLSPCVSFFWGTDLGVFVQPLLQWCSNPRKKRERGQSRCCPIPHCAHSATNRHPTI